MSKTLSDLQKSLTMSSAAMAVQKKRMSVISQNLANVNSKPETKGGIPYQRKTITFTNHLDPKTGVSTIQVKEIGKDTSPFKRVYAPGDPVADDNGYVSMTNVNAMLEMMDMREAGLSHEANLRAYEKTLRMMEETISLLKN